MPINRGAPPHAPDRGVLVKFLTGYYSRPREEERIFMFVDPAGSTATAERIGPVAFHRLLNDFIRDATGPILASQGEMGPAKQAIVYLGDTANTAARIEAACKALDADTLVSEAVAGRLAGVAGCDFVELGPVELGPVELGPVELCGRSEPVTLYGPAA